MHKKIQVDTVTTIDQEKFNSKDKQWEAKQII